MKQVSVRAYGTAQPVDEKDLDQYLAVTHARHGMPIEVRIHRNNSTHVLNLSLAEAIELSNGIERARGGKTADDMREALAEITQIPFCPSNNGERWDEGFKAGWQAAMNAVHAKAQEVS